MLSKMGIRQSRKVFTSVFNLLTLLSVVLVASVQTKPAASATNYQGESPEGGGGPGPLSTGFSYQGQLKNNGTSVNGSCDFIFKLYDQSGTGNPPTGGTQIGNPDTQLAINVNKGLFTVVINSTSQFGNAAFNGAVRYLDIAVRCPAGNGTYQTLGPRQMISGTPYTLGLRPGTYMTSVYATAYQNLKIQSSAPAGGNPAAVTGEIMSATDGVGVYGSNSVTAAGATGIGVWGRVWSPAGWGMRAEAFNGGGGLYAISSGATINFPTIYAKNTNTSTSLPAGIAIYAQNQSADATLVVQNTGAGDAIRQINSAGNSIIFAVTNTGRVVTSALQVYGGGDLAEKFPVVDATVQPGTLMVIDEQNEGMLKPSSKAYDTCVAGVVSGAGGVNPGMTLEPSNILQGNTLIAIAGRVYVRAEAFSAPIKPGDFLTSSNIPGMAMKATDRDLVQGAIVGKAMSSLEDGTGLVLVLINLQ